MRMADDYNYRMSDLEYKKYKLKTSMEAANQEFLLGEYKGRKAKATNQGGDGMY